SLGAVMDVAMSIASSANELYENNKDIENKQLFISVMNIGKDIMGTMVNTLILAFTGSSLPMIMMIWGYNMNYNQFINIPAIAIEVMNALAGSIGIISTVPFTALVSIILINKKRGEKNE
ncbi:MAG: YibE/F family protein, partial [Fusobacteriaceae bacterium]